MASIYAHLRLGLRPQQPNQLDLVGSGGKQGHGISHAPRGQVAAAAAGSWGIVGPRQAAGVL